jgi:hypothetical protein
MNSKEVNSNNLCPNYVQEFGLSYFTSPFAIAKGLEMRLSVSTGTPFSDGSLPNHTKMFELVHMVTSMKDFESGVGCPIQYVQHFLFFIQGEIWNLDHLVLSEFRMQIHTPRNSGQFYCKKYRGIPYVFQKIPYSVGSQKRTSVDTLVAPCSERDMSCSENRPEFVNV